MAHQALVPAGMEGVLLAKDTRKKKIFALGVQGEYGAARYVISVLG
jgi:hypothetical protein